MKTKYFVRRDQKEPELHIYVEYSEPENGMMGRDWMGTLRANDLEWNDHLVPDLEDMRFIISVADNFSTILAEAKEDAWDMDEGDLDIPEENFR